MCDGIRSRVFGADNEWIDKSIFRCIRYGNARMVLKLLDLGADLTNAFVCKTIGRDHMAMSRFTLLSYACRYQGIDLVREMIMRGMSLESTINREAIEVTDDCERDEDESNERHDTSYVNDDDYEDQEPYGQAPDLDYFDRRIVNKNKDIPDYDSDTEFPRQGPLQKLDMTPLAVAIHYGGMDMVTLLLQAGANPNALSMMNIPTVYSLLPILFTGIYETRHDSDQDTDFEIRGNYNMEDMGTEETSDMEVMMGMDEMEVKRIEDKHIFSLKRDHTLATEAHDLGATEDLNISTKKAKNGHNIETSEV